MILIQLNGDELAGMEQETGCIENWWTLHVYVLFGPSGWGMTIVWKDVREMRSGVIQTKIVNQWIRDKKIVDRELLR